MTNAIITTANVTGYGADSNLFGTALTTAAKTMLDSMGLNTTIAAGRITIAKTNTDGLDYQLRLRSVTGPNGFTIDQDFAGQPGIAVQGTWDSGRSDLPTSVDLTGINHPEGKLIRFVASYADGQTRETIAGLLTPAARVSFWPMARPSFFPSQADFSTLYGSNELTVNRFRYRARYLKLTAPDATPPSLPHSSAPVIIDSYADSGRIALLSEDWAIVSPEITQNFVLGNSGAVYQIISRPRTVNDGNGNQVYVGNAIAVRVASAGGAAAATVYWRLHAETIQSIPGTPPANSAIDLSGLTTITEKFWNRTASYGGTLFLNQKGVATFTSGNFLESPGMLYEGQTSGGTWTTWETLRGVSQLLKTKHLLEFSATSITVQGLDEHPADSWSDSAWADLKLVANPAHWLYQVVLNEGGVIDQALLTKWQIDWRYIADHLPSACPKGELTSITSVGLNFTWDPEKPYSANLNQAQILALRPTLGSAYLAFALLFDKATAIDYSRLLSVWGLTTAQVDSAILELEAKAIGDFRFDQVNVTYSPAIAAMTSTEWLAVDKILTSVGKFVTWMFPSPVISMTSIASRWTITNNEALKQLAIAKRTELIDFVTSYSAGAQWAWAIAKLQALTRIVVPYTWS